MARTRRPKGPKRVSYELISPDTAQGRDMYLMLRELVREHHTEILEARIALAWNTAWKPNVDGQVTLGKCKKATDLDRELAAFDFIILLRKQFWNAREVSIEQRTALLDHELCHATVKLDDRTGDPVRDERRRLVFRTRKHDIEEFEEVVRRHGCYKRDLESFFAAMMAGGEKAFEPCDQCKDSPGFVAGEQPGTVVRCQCWLDHQERINAAREVRHEARPH